MRWLLGAGVLAAVLAGCGGDDADSTYTIAFAGDPAAVGLVAAQDGDGPWQAVTLDASGHGTFTVTRGFHGALVVCTYLPSVHVAVNYDAGDDGTAHALCGSPTAAVRVRGSVTPPDAEVWIEGVPVAHVPGSYDATVGPGTYDLMASTATRMRIDRALVVTADTTHDLDVAAGGFDLVTSPLTVTGAATPSTYSELHTANAGYVQLLGTTTTVPLVPAAQRVADDRVVVGATATDGDVTRIVQRRVTAEAAPALAFVDGPPVTADRAGLHWTTGWADYWGSLRPMVGAPRVFLGMGATPAWSDASGTTALSWPDLAALPGWDPSWPMFTAGESVTWSASGSTGAYDGDLDERWASGTLTW